MHRFVPAADSPQAHRKARSENMERAKDVARSWQETGRVMQDVSSLHQRELEKTLRAIEQVVPTPPPLPQLLCGVPALTAGLGQRFPVDCSLAVCRRSPRDARHPLH